MNGRSRLALALLWVLTACQPETRRVLVLDLALAEAGAVSAVAMPWRRAGYDVDYRRFYPHPTRSDADAYRVMVLLGGIAPEAPSDALRPSDLDQLTAWVQRGGVLVIGYAGDGEGSLDRWMLNRWLDAVGTGIAIGDSLLRDGERLPWITPRDNGPVRGGGLLAFPAGRTHGLAAPPASVLASAGGRPVIAAVRVGDGLVVVASRHALESLGIGVRFDVTAVVPAPDLSRTRTFLVALARWSLRPAEWAHVPPASRRRPIDLAGAPRELSTVPTPEHPPAGASSEPVAAPVDATWPALPAWTRRQGFRLLHDDALLRPGTMSGARARILDSLVEFMEAAAVTGLWTRAAVTPLVDTTRSQQWERDVLRASWKQVAERLQTTSVRWIPGVDLLDTRLPADTFELDARGDTVAPWAALDARLWDETLRPASRAVARLAAEQGDLVAGVVLELPSYGMASGLSDPTFRVGLAGIPGDSAWKAALLTMPARARFDSLLERGRLAAFYTALERAVAQHAGVLRLDLRRIAPGRSFGIRIARPTADWFTQGLIAGLGDSSAAVWVFGEGPRSVPPSGGAIPVARLDPASLHPGSKRLLGDALFATNSGFWLDGMRVSGIAPDSLARLVRQVSRDARLPEAPARR